MADTLVIKAGGNVLYPRATGQIDSQLLLHFYNFVDQCLLNQFSHVVIVPGGVGGELFIKWGRSQGCTEPELNEIGCRLIDMTAMIVSRGLRQALREKTMICPTVPRTLDSLSTALSQYRVIAAGCAISNAITSDSLAASIAEHAHAEFKLLKSSPPFDGEKSFYTGPDCKAISLSKLQAFCNTHDRTELAGNHPSIDYLCLRIIRRAKLRTTIVLKDQICSWQPGANISEIEVCDD